MVLMYMVIAVRRHLDGDDPVCWPGERFGAAAMGKRGDAGEVRAIKSMGMSAHALYNGFCSARASSKALGCKTSTKSEQHCSNAMHSCAHDGCRYLPAAAMSAPSCEGVKDSHCNGIAPEDCWLSPVRTLLLPANLQIHANARERLSALSLRRRRAVLTRLRPSGAGRSPSL